MTKYRLLTGMLVIVSHMAWAGAAPVDSGCAHGAGNLLSGNTSGSYCQSKTSMNWWSAHAWCESIGGELIDMTKECFKQGSTPSNIQCPNLYQIHWGTVWTKNVKDESTAYFVNLSQNEVSTLGRNNPIRTALCVNFKNP